jgi:histidinol phosphatase-like enzyme
MLVVGFSVLPHHPKWTRDGNRVYVQTCAFRKPEPVLLLEGARQFGWIEKSWMVATGKRYRKRETGGMPNDPGQPC